MLVLEIQRENFNSKLLATPKYLANFGGKTPAKVMSVPCPGSLKKILKSPALSSTGAGKCSRGRPRKQDGNFPHQMETQIETQHIVPCLTHGHSLPAAGLPPPDTSVSCASLSPRSPLPHSHTHLGQIRLRSWLRRPCLRGLWLDLVTVDLGKAVAAAAWWQRPSAAQRAGRA